MACRQGSRSLLVYAKPLRAMLTDRGYASSTIGVYERALAQLSAWPQVDRASGSGLTETELRRIVRSRLARGGCTEAMAGRVSRLVPHLRALGAVGADEPTPAERVLAGYRGYLLADCRLAALTASTRGDVIRRFLAWRTAQHGGLDLPRLTVDDVHRFVLHEAHRLDRGSIGPVLDAMRSFLRFGFAVGILAADWSGTLPPVATRQHPPLRRALDPAALAALLDSCDRRTPLGLRDFAILTLLARLGLRANEVAAMRVEDIDWRAGELLVHGKGRRDERMPLPVDVGEALAAYLRHGRPASGCRAVFVRMQAPAGELGRNGVVMVPRRASRRAGIAVVGTYRLRHTTAASLLAVGASWEQVSEVLRHTRTQTSAIYVSAEPHTLDAVARAWPGARS
ncbi:MAG: tyrosine-type recombinase/integrase [Mycobacterium leprae]